MTSILEKIVAIIAPHRCIVCSLEDNVWCEGCRAASAAPLPVCVVCGAPSSDWRLCPGCQQTSGLGHVWAAGTYTGALEKVIHAYKFERVRSAHIPLAATMLDALPHDDWQVVAVPTAPSRVRQRGYDQAVLLARSIAAQRKLVLSPALIRLHSERHVGKTRAQRQALSASMFVPAPRARLQGAKVLLVDDVCTTASTLSAAARALRSAGALQVDAVVAAWQPLLLKGDLKPKG